MDRYLDLARSGPVYLRQAPVAEVVVEALFEGVRIGHYRLAAFVLMANHVHVVLLPLVAPERLLKGLKGCTARRANVLLGKTGEPFWQRESYDHWVRDSREFRRIVDSVEGNPVQAGVVAKAEEYRWSSAWPEWRLRMDGQASP
jgi:type I restriction enzyme R subunit/putative DNA methylase